MFWLILLAIFSYAVYRIRVDRRLGIVRGRYHWWRPGPSGRSVRFPLPRPPLPPELRRLVLARDGYRCRWCGSPYELEIDHMHPYSRGGSNHPSNLQVLCGPCNRHKGAAVMRQPQVAPWISGERVA